MAVRILGTHSFAFLLYNNGFIILIVAIIATVSQMNEDKVGGTCSTHEINELCIDSLSKKS
jgi:hypothetical protein